MVSDRIGFLKPFLSPPPLASAPEVERAAERAAAPDLAERRGAGTDLPPGMAEQIRIVLDQLARIHDQATQDGAGLPSSRSGEALKGALAGLSSLLGDVPPGAASAEVQALMRETSETVARVDESLNRSAEAVTNLLSRLDVREQSRLAEQAQRFFAEARVFIAQVQSAAAMVLG